MLRSIVTADPSGLPLVVSELRPTVRIQPGDGLGLMSSCSQRAMTKLPRDTNHITIAVPLIMGMVALRWPCLTRSPGRDD